MAGLVRNEAFSVGDGLAGSLAERYDANQHNELVCEQLLDHREQRRKVFRMHRNHGSLSTSTSSVLLSTRRCLAPHSNRPQRHACQAAGRGKRSTHRESRCALIARTSERRSA